MGCWGYAPSGHRQVVRKLQLAEACGLPLQLRPRQCIPSQKGRGPSASALLLSNASLMRFTHEPARLAPRSISTSLVAPHRATADRVIVPRRCFGDVFGAEDKN